MCLVRSYVVLMHSACLHLSLNTCVHIRVVYIEDTCTKMSVSMYSSCWHACIDACIHASKQAHMKALCHAPFCHPTNPPILSPRMLKKLCQHLHVSSEPSLPKLLTLLQSCTQKNIHLLFQRSACFLFKFLFRLGKIFPECSAFAWVVLRGLDLHEYMSSLCFMPQRLTFQSADHCIERKIGHQAILSPLESLLHL